jgi:hypothetical protein
MFLSKEFSASLVSHELNKINEKNPGYNLEVIAMTGITSHYKERVLVLYKLNKIKDYPFDEIETE